MPGAVVTVCFDVQVNSDTTGQSIANQAYVSSDQISPISTPRSPHRTVERCHQGWLSERRSFALRPVLAYRKRVLHSPAAQRLLRQSDVTWTAFESPQELEAQATQALAQVVLDRGEQFGLHLDDVGALMALLETQEGEEEEETLAGPDRRRGAGRGGVILGHGT